MNECQLAAGRQATSFVASLSIASTSHTHHCCSLLLIHACVHAHLHTQPFYGSLDFVRDNSSEPIPEETFTHSHLSWSSIFPYLLPPSITIHDILPVQFMRLPDSLFAQCLILLFLVASCIKAAV